MERFRTIRSCVLLAILSLLVIYGIIGNKNCCSSRMDLKLIKRHNSRKGQEELQHFIPEDNVIDAMSSEERDELYWQYVNSLQIICNNQMRFGRIKDGGKYVCLDQQYKPKGHCIVYSFGSNFQFDFEEAVYRHFKCEIHTFDPSKPLPITKKPDEIHFHYIGLGAENNINDKGWRLNTLRSLQSSLGHTEHEIDILKIDIEKGEWSALPEILDSGSLHNVKQLCIEIHYNTTQGAKQLKTLRRLYEAGFHIFMHEPNPIGTKLIRYPYNSMTTLNELSMINIHKLKDMNMYVFN